MKVAVIQGGPSSEAEVSRASALCVESALQSAGHDTCRIELTAKMTSELLSFGPDAVFPAVHGRQGEDGCLQGVLEVLGLRYVGSDVRGSAIAADKIASKVFFLAAGLRVAAQRVFSAKQKQGDSGELLQALRQELGTEFVVKPATGGSTLGISRIRSQDGEEALTSALAEAFLHDDQVLVEQFIVGKEVTCAVLEGPDGPRALPVTLLNARASDWMDFRSKYGAEGAEHLCPAPIPAELSLRVQEAAIVAHCALGLRDLSRTDFIIPSVGEPVILEVNTLPGMTNVSLFPEAAQAAGISFPDLVDGLVRRAQARRSLVVVAAEPLPAK